jgi:hypothetical protein
LSRQRVAELGHPNPGRGTGVEQRNARTFRQHVDDLEHPVPIASTQPDEGVQQRRGSARVFLRKRCNGLGGINLHLLIVDEWDVGRSDPAQVLREPHVGVWGTDARLGEDHCRAMTLRAMPIIPVYLSLASP